MGAITGVILTPLKIIPGESGNVWHAMKQSEKSFAGFGEAYFSGVKKGDIKGWKRHTQMMLNLVVPVGSIQFVMFDDRKESSSQGEFFEVVLSQENYQRLTVPPGVWMAFRGISESNLLLNIASIEHDPTEAENQPIATAIIPYNFST